MNHTALTVDYSSAEQQCWRGGVRQTDRLSWGWRCAFPRSQHPGGSTTVERSKNYWRWGCVTALGGWFAVVKAACKSCVWVRDNLAECVLEESTSQRTDSNIRQHETIAHSSHNRCHYKGDQHCSSPTNSCHHTQTTPQPFTVHSAGGGAGLPASIALKSALLLGLWSSPPPAACLGASARGMKPVTGRGCCWSPPPPAASPSPTSMCRFWWPINAAAAVVTG